MRLPQRKLTWLWIVLGAALALRFCWISIIRSGAIDLYVYWKSIQLWLKGTSPYEYSGREGAIVFKYPPWILPLFLPLALGGFEFWHWLWAPIQVAAILYCVRWVVHAGVSLDLAGLVAAAFWWIWLGHGQAGQFTLIVLVVALWAIPPEEDRAIEEGPASCMALLMSSKVFNLFSLFGVLRAVLRPRVLAICGLALVLLNALALGVLHFHGNSLSLVALYQEWIRAGSSGGAMFPAETIRGQGNHSFTAAILRFLDVAPEDSSKDIWVAAGLGVLFSTLWYRLSRGLTRAERWAGWIAVGVVIHPLLWQHSFVLIYPLCALALGSAVKSGSRVLVAMAGLALFLIALLIPNIFGMDFVKPFELLASKSWGVALVCVVLVLSRRAASSERR